jgi:20S proteasome subunit alpha 6
MPLGSGARGGMGGGRGGANMARGGKSGFMNNRGGPANRGGRGGGMHGGMSGPVRGGGQGMGSSGSLRGHGSRGNFYGNNNRRGGGSFNTGRPDQHQPQGPAMSQAQGGSFRGRGGHFNQNRSAGHKHDSHGARDGHAPPLGPSGSVNQIGGPGKKDENRRTLTDFKIIGLEIADLEWRWGALPKPSTADVKKEEVPPDVSDLSESTQPVEDSKETSDGNIGGSVPQTQPDEAAGAGTASTAIKREPTEAVLAPEGDQSAATVLDMKAGAYGNSYYAQASAASPPSRIRIYFHTPVTADDSHPIPHSNGSSYTHVIGGGVPLGPAADSGRKGKRARRDRDDDSDGDAEEGRTRPPPPGEMDRESIAASVDMDENRGSVAPSVTMTEPTSEGDWLMAAMGEGEHGTDPDADGDAQTVVDDHGDELASHDDFGLGGDQPPEHGADVDASKFPAASGYASTLGLIPMVLTFCRLFL